MLVSGRVCVRCLAALQDEVLPKMKRQQTCRPQDAEFRVLMGFDGYWKHPKTTFILAF